MKTQNYFGAFFFFYDCHVNLVKKSYDSLRACRLSQDDKQFKVEEFSVLCRSGGITNRRAAVHPQLSTYLFQWRSHQSGEARPQ